MRRHHTKNKGDLGVMHAQLDLVQKGYSLFVPMSEHEAFDLVAYRDGRFLRIQVKYRAAVNGVIRVKFESSWADRHGVHTALTDKNDVDVFCVYCPDTRRCYYIDPRLHGRCVNLRIAAARNGQAKRVLLADDFTSFPTP